MIGDRRNREMYIDYLNPGYYLRDVHHLIDERQFYLVKKAGNQLNLNSGEREDFDFMCDLARKDEVRLDLSWIEATIKDEESECEISEAEAIDDLVSSNDINKYDAHYYEVSTRIANDLRLQIKQIVKSYGKLHKFNLSYCGVAVTDVEYQSLLNLSNGCLIMILICSYWESKKKRWSPCGDWGYYSGDYYGGPVKLAEIDNWKDFVTDNDLDTDYLKQCDANFWKGYHQLKSGDD